MKKLLLSIFAATTVVAFQATAITVTVNQVAGYYVSDGEFNVSPVTGVGYGAADLYNNNSGALGFGTFCIDRNTSITIPGTYNATVIANGIDPNNGNQISLGTAWLFQQFAQGVLANYNYTPGANRANSAYLLQNAIWVLEGQIGNNFNDIFLTMATTQFGSLGAAEADNNQTYGVGVLSLVGLNGVPAQSMLSLLPTPVPDGGSALLLLGMSLSGLALISRKIRA